MGRHAQVLDLLAGSLPAFSVLEVCELLILARNELARRASRDASELVERALKLYAEDVVTPDSPSDNGNRAPGDNGADA
jgi:hypothetical protein